MSRGADGVDDVVLVETPWYKFRFILWETGSADSVVYKPLQHELRAENYYKQPHEQLSRLGCGWPIPTRSKGIRGTSTIWKSRTVAIDCHPPSRAAGPAELVLEFETPCSTAGGRHGWTRC